MPDSLHDDPVTYVEKYREDCPENTPEPYAVGYRKPPRSGHFKKGHPSPNPNGRPKRRPESPKSVDDYIDAELEKKVPFTVNGKTMMIPQAQAIAKGLVNDAREGDRRARDQLLKRSKDRKPHRGGLTFIIEGGDDE